MSQSRTPESSNSGSSGEQARNDDATAAASARTDTATHDRLEATKVQLARAETKLTRLTNTVMALLPVRVWRHFLDRNGFLLAAGMSYQSIFAIFAGIYVAFAVAGFWLLGNPNTFTALVDLIDQLAPGLVSTSGSGGVITEASLKELAESGQDLFGWTGLIAIGGLLWTATAYMTYARMAVRSAFGLPKDRRPYVLVKSFDAIGALVFGIALVVAAVVSIVATSLLSWVSGLLGIPPDSAATELSVRVGGLVLVFIINTLSIAGLFKFLSGASMHWSRLWRGSLLGGIALSVLQLLANLIVTLSTQSPIYATFAAFAIFLVMMLWFRLTNIVILTAASWIAVEAADRDENLRRISEDELEAEQTAIELQALTVAAEVRVRRARELVTEANWFQRPGRARALREAREDLEQARADAATHAATMRKMPRPNRIQAWLDS